MKFFASIVLCLLITSVVFAQDAKLPYDERGKLIYYEVVEKGGTSAEELASRATKFVEKNKSIKLTLGKTDTLWEAKGKLMINKTAFVLSRPSGEVTYNLYIGFKNDKYRFWLTDFNFIPYQRDRYGNFVPTTKIGVPLETKLGKFNAAEWDSYLKATAREASVFAAKFKEAMADRAIVNPEQKATPAVSTVKRDW